MEPQTTTEAAETRPFFAPDAITSDHQSGSHEFSNPACLQTFVHEPKSKSAGRKLQEIFQSNEFWWRHREKIQDQQDSVVLVWTQEFYHLGWFPRNKHKHTNTQTNKQTNGEIGVWSQLIQALLCYYLQHTRPITAMVVTVTAPTVLLWSPDWSLSSSSRFQKEPPRGRFQQRWRWIRFQLPSGPGAAKHQPSWGRRSSSAHSRSDLQRSQPSFPAGTFPTAVAGGASEEPPQPRRSCKYSRRIPLSDQQLLLVSA